MCLKLSKIKLSVKQIRKSNSKFTTEIESLYQVINFINEKRKFIFLWCNNRLNRKTRRDNLLHKTN